MKNAIYIIVSVLLVLGSFTVLLLYYTQNFDEELNFKKSLAIKDLEIQKNDRGGVNYLNFVKAEIGTLTLKNKGYFAEVYRTPRLVGCINAKEGIPDDNLKINNFQFEIYYLGDNNQVYPGTAIDVPVGEEKSYKIIGQYNSYDLPVYVFEDSVSGVSVYEIPPEEKNPLDDGSYYSDRIYYGNDNCNAIRDKLKPIATIKVSA